MAQRPIATRNWVVRNPLLRKSGVHQPARLTQRPRLDTRQALADFDSWQDDLLDNEQDDNIEGPQGPSAFIAPSLSRHTSH